MVRAECSQHLGGDAVALAEQGQQEMPGAAVQLLPGVLLSQAPKRSEL
jgi:hypothetical protein